MLDQFLAALTHYGTPALFVVVAVAALGIPLPVTLLLIVTGSLVAQGAMDLWLAIATATVGSVAGDQVGYAVGRWGGKVLVTRMSRMLGKPERLKELEAKAKSWGGAGVFFSRWLITPLGPWINLASGAADYSWIRFTLWDVLGESLSAALFIWLGLVFSDRVQQVGAIFGDMTWAILGILVAGFLGWRLFFRRESAGKQDTIGASKPTI